MYIEKHKHVAILESIHTFPWISQKPFWQHFVCVCVRMSVSQGFPPPGAKDWPQTQCACHCKGPAAPSISANRHCLGFPPVCIFRMIIVQNIQYVCAIMEREWLLLFRHRKWPCADQWWPHEEGDDLGLASASFVGLAENWILDMMYKSCTEAPLVKLTILCRIH